MPLFEFISIILLGGIWFGISDIPFTFAGVVRSGALKYRNMGIMLFLALMSGNLLCSTNSWTSYETNWKVATPTVSLIIAISAGITILASKKQTPFNAVVLALMGSIWGWQLFNGTLIKDMPLFSSYTAWVLTPVISGILAAVFLILMRSFILKKQIHLIHLSAYLRIGILVTLLLAAIAIGVNNAPLLLSLIHSSGAELSEFSPWGISARPLTGILALFLIFIVSYLPAKQKLMRCDPKYVETNSVYLPAILLSLSIVLGFFSSETLCRAVGLTVTPVSPVHASIGAMAGISLAGKGGKTPPAMIIRMGISILLIPLIALALSYILFTLISPYVSLYNPASSVSSTESSSLIIPLIVILLAGILLAIASTFRKQKRLRIEAQNALKQEQRQYDEAQRVMTGMELRTIQLENENLTNKLEIKRKELINLALNINEQRSFYDHIYSEIKAIQAITDMEKTHKRLGELAQIISHKMTFSDEMNGFYSQVEELHKHFITNLMERFPNLTEQEKRLATLLRLGFTTKDIAGIMNISPKSAEISRYRLRKRFGLKREDNLIQYIKSL